MGAIRVELERPADAESLIDEQRFDDDEFLPYWAEQWPSGLALAEHLSTLPRRRRSHPRAGLRARASIARRSETRRDRRRNGLVERRACAARAKRGAQRHHRRDCGRPTGDGRRCSRRWVASTSSWRQTSSTRSGMSRRSSTPFAASARATLVADPGRRHAEAFLDAVRMQGWAVTTVAHAQIPRGGIHRLEPIGLRPS